MIVFDLLLSESCRASVHYFHFQVILPSSFVSVVFDLLSSLFGEFRRHAGRSQISRLVLRTKLKQVRDCCPSLIWSWLLCLFALCLYSLICLFGIQLVRLVCSLLSLNYWLEVNLKWRKKLLGQLLMRHPEEMMIRSGLFVQSSSLQWFLPSFLFGSLAIWFLKVVSLLWRLSSLLATFELSMLPWKQWKIFWSLVREMQWRLLLPASHPLIRIHKHLKNVVELISSKHCNGTTITTFIRKHFIFFENSSMLWKLTNLALLLLLLLLPPVPLPPLLLPPQLLQLPPWALLHLHPQLHSTFNNYPKRAITERPLYVVRLQSCGIHSSSPCIFHFSFLFSHFSFLHLIESSFLWFQLVRDNVHAKHSCLQRSQKPL